MMTCGFVGVGFSKDDVATMFMGLPAQRDRLPNLCRFEFKPHQNMPSDREREGWEELYLRCKEMSIRASRTIKSP